MGWYLGSIMVDEAFSDVAIVSNSPEMTVEIGKILGENLQRGDIIALIGELGSGKTCITQGIARGLRVSEEYYITSPTFTLINEYPGRLTLYHLDVYRLSGSDDLIDMGYEEYFYDDGVIVIEWAEKVQDILPSYSIRIHMKYIDETRRKIAISGKSEKIDMLYTELRRENYV